MNIKQIKKARIAEKIWLNNKKIMIHMIMSKQKKDRNCKMSKENKKKINQNKKKAKKINKKKVEKYRIFSMTKLKKVMKVKNIQNNKTLI